MCVHLFKVLFMVHKSAYRHTLCVGVQEYKNIRVALPFFAKATRSKCAENYSLCGEFFQHLRGFDLKEQSVLKIVLNSAKLNFLFDTLHVTFGQMVLHLFISVCQWNTHASLRIEKNAVGSVYPYTKVRQK